MGGRGGNRKKWLLAVGKAAGGPGLAVTYRWYTVGGNQKRFGRNNLWGSGRTPFLFKPMHGAAPHSQ